MARNGWTEEGFSFSDLMRACTRVIITRNPDAVTSIVMDGHTRAAIQNNDHGAGALEEQHFNICRVIFAG